MSDGDDYQDFEIVTLIEGVLITTPLDLWPGLGIWPVDDPRHRLGIAAVMDSLLTSNGWNIGRSTAEAFSAEPPDLPLAIVHHTVRADTTEEAWHLSKLFVDLVLGTLALRRGAAGTPLLSVYRRRHGDPTIPEYQVFPDTPPYSGNTIGGVLSGEDPDGLRSVLSATEDPLVRLWLGACRDLRRERDRSFKLHRWWNLAEAIATSRDQPVGLATDFEGKPLVWAATGKAVSTAGQAGLVYTHIKERFIERNMSERSFTGPFKTLWPFVSGWCGLRNAVAHYGQFDPELHPKMREQRWFADALTLHQWDLESGRLAMDVDAFGDLLIEWEIAHRSGWQPPSEPQDKQQWQRITTDTAVPPHPDPT